MPSSFSNKPTSYQEAVAAIDRRRLASASRRLRDNAAYMAEEARSTSLQQSSSKLSTSSSQSKRPSESSKQQSQQQQQQRRSDPPRGMSKDPVRLELLHTIEKLRQESKVNFFLCCDHLSVRSLGSGGSICLHIASVYFVPNYVGQSG